MDGELVDSEDLTCSADGVASADVPDTDCQDDDALAHPGAVETVGDEQDIDCDGRELCYADLDDDGYRTADIIHSLDTDCTDAGEATEADLLVDCDDTRPGVNPGAPYIGSVAIRPSSQANHRVNSICGEWLRSTIQTPNRCAAVRRR